MKTSYKKYIKIIIFIIIISLFLNLVVIMRNNSSYLYIKKHYLVENKISTYANMNNPEFLSESMGLFLIYLLENNKKDIFEKEFNELEKYFVYRKNNVTFIKWKLDKDINTNALIDDLRISYVLKSASKKFKNSRYENLSNEIILTIKEKMIINNNLVEFYDWKYNIPAKNTQLSYLDFDYVKLIDSKLDLLKPLKSLEAKPFFYEIYDGYNYFESNIDEVNMIDQLLIAINYFKYNKEKNLNFDAFINYKLKSEKKIYSRYSRKNLAKIKEEESTSVYVLLKIYFELTEQKENIVIAEELIKNINVFDINKIHFFDFINKEIKFIHIFKD